MSNPNENCLACKQCPHCGSTGGFRVMGIAMFFLEDDGTDEFRDVEFEDGALAYCNASGCNYSGPWSSFNDSIVAPRRP